MARRCRACPGPAFQELSPLRHSGKGVQPLLPADSLAALSAEVQACKPTTPKRWRACQRLEDGESGSSQSVTSLVVRGRLKFRALRSARPADPRFMTRTIRAGASSLRRSHTRCAHLPGGSFAIGTTLHLWHRRFQWRYMATFPSFESPTSPSSQCFRGEQLVLSDHHLEIPLCYGAVSKSSSRRRSPRSTIPTGRTR